MTPELTSKTSVGCRSSCTHTCTRKTCLQRVDMRDGCANPLPHGPPPTCFHDSTADLGIASTNTVTALALRIRRDIVLDLLSQVGRNFSNIGTFLREKGRLIPWVGQLNFTNLSTVRLGGRSAGRVDADAILPDTAEADALADLLAGINVGSGASSAVTAAADADCKANAMPDEEEEPTAEDESKLGFDAGSTAAVEEAAESRGQLLPATVAPEISTGSTMLLAGSAGEVGNLSLDMVGGGASTAQHGEPLSSSDPDLGLAVAAAGDHEGDISTVGRNLMFGKVAEDGTQKSGAKGKVMKGMKKLFGTKKK